jgi:hypothetical protein
MLLNCLNPPVAAIQIVGEGVRIDNVTVTGGSPVFDVGSAGQKGVNVRGLRVTDVVSESPDDVVGVIGNANGAVAELGCQLEQYVIEQPLHTYAVGTTTKCIRVNIGELTGFYGTEYEIEYYTPYGGATGLTGFYSRVIGIEFGVVVVGVCAMIVLHQDTAYLIGARVTAERAKKDD